MPTKYKNRRRNTKPPKTIAEVGANDFRQSGVNGGRSLPNNVKRKMAKRHGYRSDFELQLAKKLADRGVDFRYEARKFEYIPDPRNYTPDFYFPDLNLYIEAKGELTKADRVKHLLIKKQYPDLDLRFVFVRASNKIYKGSKTTYADWCERHGFMWAEGAIPPEWLKEDTDG